jgi:guanylate kinase
MSNDFPAAGGFTKSGPVTVARGMLVVVSSPSGGGKGTIIKRVRKMVPDLGYSVSFTTRAPRPNEVDGRDYHFVTPSRFEEMRARGEFLEWAVVHGNLYGTAYSEIERELASGRDVILEIDVQGAASVRQRTTGAVCIFILPPTYEVLRERLLRRGSESPAELQRRLGNSRGEVERYREFAYVIVNDDADRAAAQLAAIVTAERVRRERQEEVAQRVLATFP